MQCNSPPMTPDWPSRPLCPGWCPQATSVTPMSTVPSSMRPCSTLTYRSKRMEHARSGPINIRQRPSRVTDFLSGNKVLGLVSVLIGLGVWELAASQFHEIVLPPPSAVLARFFDPDFLSRLLPSLGNSLFAFAVGF